MEIVQTEHAPKAIGPYSQAIKTGDLLFTAGQIPLDPSTMKLVEGDISVQTERVMQNLSAILAAAGSSMDRVVKTTCFLQNLEDFPAFNAVYSIWFPASPPSLAAMASATPDFTISSSRLRPSKGEIGRGSSASM